MATEQSPNVGLAYGWETGQDGWGGLVNFNWILLDVVTNPVAVSATTRVRPSSPRDGDKYVIPLDAEGAWAEYAGRIAYHVGGQWHYIQPKRGWLVRPQDTGASLWFSGEAWVPFVGDKGDKGDRGYSILIDRQGNELRWRSTEPGAPWSPLLPLSDITGPPVSLRIGQVFTSAPGAAAQAAITGEGGSLELNLVLPRGAEGPANNLRIGTVSTLPPGSEASASIAGAYPFQVLNLALPRGNAGQGDPGPAGPAGIVPRGAWDPNTFYEKHDGVLYSGSQWIRLVEGFTLTDPANDPANWALFLPGIDEETIELDAVADFEGAMNEAG